MAVTLEDFANGLAETVKTHAGLRAVGYMPDTIEPPMGCVRIEPLDLGAFALGQLDVAFEFYVFCTRISDRSSAKKLYAFMSPIGDTSIWRAVNEHGDLGLDGVSAAIVTMREFTFEEFGVIGYPGAVFSGLASISGV